MAVIGRIRKRVGLLLVFIGGSLLLFVLGEAITSTSGLFGRSSTTIGVIGGETITYPEFQRKVDEMTENFKSNQNVETVDQNTTEQLREQAWNDYINKIVMVKQYEKAHISCSPSELFAWITSREAPYELQQLGAFKNKDTQMFDPNEVVKFLKSLPNRDERDQAAWKQFETYLHDQRVANKYKGLTRGGLYVTNEEAKRDFFERNRTASVQYVMLNYSTVPDGEVKFDESDLKKYYKEHSYLPEYNSKDDTRKAEYVVWDVLPSEMDKKEADEKMNKLYEEYKSTTDNALFVNQNTETFFDSAFKKKGDLPPNLDTALFNAEIGTMFGPYEENGSMKIAKLLAVKYEPDSVKARHILLKVANGDTTAAKAKADSLKQLIRMGQSFATLAMQVSEDKVSGAKGGDLDWFTHDRMVAPFADACFSGKKGDMPVVVSQFGVHLIEIQDQSQPVRKVQVGIVERRQEPSQKTYDEVYAKATKFAVESNTGELFNLNVEKQGLNKRVTHDMREYDKFVPGLDQPRELIRWAFQAKKGDVSNKVMQFGDKYVVAHLVEVKEKGQLPLETVKDQVAVAVRKEKKGQMLADKLNKAMSGGAALETVAEKVSSTAATAESVNFKADFIPGIGNEPKVIGNIFTLKENVTSKPIVGENGVFVVKVTKFNEPVDTKDYSGNKRDLTQALQGRSDGEITNALKERANIVDNRGKFY